MKVKDTFQQGDVLGRRVHGPTMGKVLAKGRIVVAHGEGGHSHVLEAEEDEAQLIAMGDRILLNLEKGATLTHEEHGPVEVPAGVWEIGKVQEYDWFSQMKRDVID